MGTHISHSPSETEALGAAWGREAQAGTVIGLSGDLGSGKTLLVKGLARGLGIPGQVHSPTFALVNEYRGGRLPLFHLDLFRLNTPEEIEGAGLAEYLFNPAAVTVIEWIDHWLNHRDRPQPPFRFRHVRLETLSENERKISYEDFGP